MGLTRQRKLGTCGVAVVLFGALAASGCGSEKPGSWEPVGTVSDAVVVCADGPVIQGIDVSYHQQTINWTQVAGDGIDFAIVKATEGNGYVDDTFADNWQNARAAGLAVGTYHFFRANFDGTSQANHYLSVIGTVEPGDITPVLDLETTDGQDASTIIQRALDFLDAVEVATGRTPIIYTSPNVYINTLGSPASFGDYLLWIANWEVNCPDVPATWDDWTIWQKANNGSVAGISTNVDLDEFDGTVEELQCAGVQCATGTCVAGVCTGAGGGGAGGGGEGGAGGEGEGGVGGEGGQEPAGGGDPVEVVPGVSGDDEGCSCKVTLGSSPTQSLPTGVFVGALLGALGALRRRPRHRPRRR